jgi:hypothetical protein
MSAPGVVSKLWRYPVKSMLGEACASFDLNERGVKGDRLFAVRDADGKLGSGKTTRRFSRIDGLFAFRAIDADGAPEIVFPDGRRMRADDMQIHAELSSALGQPVTLAREAVSSHLDAAPVHLVTEASIAWLSSILPEALIDERRFRPNLVLAIPGTGRIEEEDWIGATLCVGAQVKLKIGAATERCRMVTVAQVELPDDPRILKEIGRNSALHFGLYADVLVPGTIRCGDPIRCWKP